MSRFENNLSKGNVVKQLIVFSYPFLLSNLIQTLYGVVDMIVVGKYAGTASMSGVNIGGQISFVLTNAVFGLCVGATVLIGQYLGAGKKDELRETIGTLFTSLALLAIVLTVGSLIFDDQLLELIKTPAESYSEAKSYLIVTMLGTIFIFGYNALSAIMRGMGDSKNPLIFVTIACVINIGLDLLFVAVFKTGATGAAIATVASQAISMILCILYLARNNFIFDFKLSSFGFHNDRLKLLLKLGIPTSIQNIAVNTSFLFLTALVNSIGFVASAAVGAVGKLTGFAILPAIAMSSSVSAMSAQNLGAGEEERASKTMKIGMLIAVVINVTIFILVRLFPKELLSIFNDDADMIAHGLVYMSSLSYDYLVVPFIFCLNGLFIGSGHTTFSLINGIMSSLLIRIPAAYILGMVLDMGLWGVGLGAPIASFISLVLCVWFYFSGKWKKAVIIHR